MLGTLLVFVCTVAVVWYWRRHRYKLPPGPWALPILGNALQFKPKSMHLQLQQWAEQYGSMYTINLLGDTIVVINDEDLIRDVLIKR